jgi:hypothetical protein
LESIATKEIAFAVFGGAAAIASVLLIFVGFMIAKADALPSTTPDETIRSFTLLAKCGLIPVLAQAIVTLASYAWMFFPSSSVLFYTWAIGFPVALVLFVVYSVVVTARL